VQREFGEQLEVVYTTNDGTLGIEGFVTTPLETMLETAAAGTGRAVAEVVAIGPQVMMRAVSDLTRRFGVHTMASLNSIMVDATGMCGACMVPVTVDGKTIRKHACIDAHIIDRDKLLPRFGQFRVQQHGNGNVLNSPPSEFRSARARTEHFMKRLGPSPASNRIGFITSHSETDRTGRTCHAAHLALSR
jgi:hypothetical protein